VATRKTTRKASNSRNLDEADLGAPEGQSISVPIFYEAGRSGLKISAGLIDEEFLRDLRGQKADKIYQEMANNSPVIGGALWLIESLLRRVTWEFRPRAGGSDRYVEFFEQCRNDMETSWDEFISETIAMAIHGFLPVELVYKVRRGPKAPEGSLRSEFDDGMIGWRDFATRSPDSRDEWVFDDFGNVIAMIQEVETDPKTRIIPWDKVMNLRLRSRKNSPEGLSILRHAYMPYFFWKKLQQVEAIGIERSLAGYPKFTAPAEAFAQDSPNNWLVERMRQWAQQVRQHELAGMVVPSSQGPNGETGWGFELISASGASKAESDPVIQRYRSDQAIALMSQFMLLGQQGVGSFSLSSDQSSTLAMALGAWLDSICENVNNKAVRQLGELNRLDMQDLPELTHSDIEKPDIAKTASALQQLVTAGAIIPTTADEEQLRQLLELPAASEGEPMAPEMPTGDPGGQIGLFP
jgi:hypothetical protein